MSGRWWPGLEMHKAVHDEIVRVFNQSTGEANRGL